MGQGKGESAKLVIFIRADAIGRGEDELGANLMMNFLHQLSVTDRAPDVLIMMNAGVKLVVDKSEVLESLIGLSDKGTEILVCGTCLDFFGLREKQQVGKASNMVEIVRVLLTASKVITV